MILSLKKEYEKDLDTFCIVMHATEDKKEEANDKMKKMHIDSINAHEFYSHLTDAAQNRYNSLVLNRLINVPMKYEVLKGVHVGQMVRADK